MDYFSYFLQYIEEERDGWTIIELKKREMVGLFFLLSTSSLKKREMVGLFFLLSTSSLKKREMVGLFFLLSTLKKREMVGHH